MVTINDIARLAHVDKGAVSRTLRNHRDAQRLRPETRERILRIAAELGYQPNQLASSTRTGIVRSLALIGHFLTSTLYFSAAQIISGILSESTKQGYGVKMYDSVDLKKAFAEIVGNRIRYVLSLCPERPAREEQARFCRENGIQIVYLYEHAVGEYPAVNIDNLAASSLLVRHLAERGHRRIALLCVPHKEDLYSYVRERHEGYFRSMEELGLPVDPDLVSCSDDVEAAVADVSAKLDILAAHQQELEHARSETVINLITLFGIVSILASVLSIVQILSDGNTLIWASTILTTGLLALATAFALRRR